MFDDFLAKAKTDLIRSYHSDLHPPASASAVSELVHRYLDLTTIALPRDYLSLLELTNGVEWDGIEIFATTTTPISGYQDRFINGLIEAYLDYYADYPFIVVGSLEEELIAYSLENQRYELLDGVSGDVNDVSDSLEGLLSIVLRRRDGW